MKHATDWEMLFTKYITDNIKEMNKKKTDDAREKQEGHSNRHIPIKEIQIVKIIWKGAQRHWLLGKCKLKPPRDATTHASE